MMVSEGIEQADDLVGGIPAPLGQDLVDVLANLWRRAPDIGREPPFEQLWPASSSRGPVESENRVGGWC